MAEMRGEKQQARADQAFQRPEAAAQQPVDRPDHRLARTAAELVGDDAKDDERAEEQPGESQNRPTRFGARGFGGRSEEHTSELQSLMRSSYAVFCLKKNSGSDRSRMRRQEQRITHAPNKQCRTTNRKPRQMT